MHTDCGPDPTQASVGWTISWFEWHCTHPGNPILAKAAWCGLFSKSCAKKTWQVPQTLATELTPGGVAPWLPWQVVAGGRGSVPSRQRLGVHALLVVRDLVGGNVVALHVGGVGVAAGAGGGHVRRVDRRARVGDGEECCARRGNRRRQPPWCRPASVASRARWSDTGSTGPRAFED